MARNLRTFAVQTRNPAPEAGNESCGDTPAHWRSALEWVLSGLLGLLVYTLRAVRKRDAARASAAHLRNLPTEPEAGPRPAPDGSRPGGGTTASILQPGPRVLRIREESDR
jgi:hypothetical protein